jgi:hypothetical protein
MKINSFAALALSAASTAPVAQTVAELPNVEHHWLANTGGNKDDHIANFLTDMVVWYPHDWQLPEKIVLAASFWDEGSCGYCAYSEGRSLGKAEWFKDTIHSDRAWRLGKRCSIGNLWGRNFLDHEGPPPVGDSAPYVACDDHDTLRSVVDPTAVAFDMAGDLLVSDNGPDQDVKIFSLANRALHLVRTFGDSGGVFAGPHPGEVGIRRFWGIRGLGVDSQGNVYVGNTGIPEQTMGGTDIRVFSGTDSSLLWQVQGLSFVNDADADPSSNGQDLYLNAKRFRMDYGQAPGKSWKLAGVTLDPFRFPNDPRLTNPMESVWERRIGGKRFQYHTNMVGGFVYVARFEEGSEIGIPTAFFCTYQDFQTGWGSDSAPTWERNESNKRLRWYWVDRNGDGIAQASEFGTYENWNLYNQGIDVDANGDIWLGGEGDTSTQFRGGGVARIRAGTLDANGVPAFDLSSIGRWSVPFTQARGGAIRIRHVVGGDRMFLAEGANAWYSAGIHVYENFTDPSRQREVCRIDLGYDDQGQTEIHLDQNTADMTLPFSFTADSQFVYAVYLDNGRYSRRRGEVTVYDARTCQPVGWMAPDSVHMAHFSGTVDLVDGVNVAVQADGHRVVMEEEDGAGKVLAFRWCPDSAPCAANNGVHPASRSVGDVRWRSAPGRLQVWAPAGSAIEIRDVRGSVLESGTARGSDLPTTLDLRGRGMRFASVRGPSGTTRFGVLAP